MKHRIRWENKNFDDMGTLILYIGIIDLLYISTSLTQAEVVIETRFFCAAFV